MATSSRTSRLAPGMRPASQRAWCGGCTVSIPPAQTCVGTVISAGSWSHGRAMSRNSWAAADGAWEMSGKLVRRIGHTSGHRMTSWSAAGRMRVNCSAARSRSRPVCHRTTPSMPARAMGAWRPSRNASAVDRSIPARPPTWSIGAIGPSRPSVATRSGRRAASAQPKAVPPDSANTPTRRTSRWSSIAARSSATLVKVTSG